MRLIFCGGRDYSGAAQVGFLFHRLVKKYGMFTVIHGAAPGADTLVDREAKRRGLDVIACPAEWDKYGRSAGPKRNAYMLTLEPDGVVAFPGGRGTADMVRQARKAGIKVMEVERCRLS